MPIITSDKAQPEYDVAIVGSGAGGGQMAYTLTQAGLKCVMLESGRSYNPDTETAMFQRPDQGPLSSVSTPEKFFGFWDATVNGGWSVQVSRTPRQVTRRRNSSGGGGRA